MDNSGEIQLWQNVIDEVDSRGEYKQIHTIAIDSILTTSFLNLGKNLQGALGLLGDFQNALDKYGVEYIINILKYIFSFQKESGLSRSEFDFILKEAYSSKPSLIKTSNFLPALKSIPGVGDIINGYLAIKGIYYSLYEVHHNVTPVIQDLGIGPFEVFSPYTLQDCANKNSNDPAKLSKLAIVCRSMKIVASEFGSAIINILQECYSVFSKAFKIIELFFAPETGGLTIIAGFALDFVINMLFNIANQRLNTFTGSFFDAVRKQIRDIASTKISLFNSTGAPKSSTFDDVALENSNIHEFKPIQFDDVALEDSAIAA